MTTIYARAQDQALADAGFLFISIQGINSSTGRLKSTTPIQYRVLPGTPSLVVSAPTPHVYEQLASKTAVPLWYKSKMQGDFCGFFCYFCEFFGVLRIS